MISIGYLDDWFHFKGNMVLNFMPPGQKPWVGRARRVMAAMGRPMPGGRIFLKRRAPGIQRTTAETQGGTNPGDHAFFCNFLLTKALPQFNMAVDKTGKGKEVG
jgi:hypothetical protein